MSTSLNSQEVAPHSQAPAPTAPSAHPPAEEMKIDKRLEAKLFTTTEQKLLSMSAVHFSDAASAGDLSGTLNPFAGKVVDLGKAIGEMKTKGYSTEECEIWVAKRKVMDAIFADNSISSIMLKRCVPIIAEGGRDIVQKRTHQCIQLLSRYEEYDFATVVESCAACLASYRFPLVKLAQLIGIVESKEEYITVDVKKVSAKMNTMADFAAFHNKLKDELPPKFNYAFMHDVGTGAKKLMKSSQVLRVKVPHFDEFDLGKFIAAFPHYKEVMTFVPDYKRKLPDREFFFNVANTITDGKIAEMIDEAYAKRAAKPPPTLGATIVMKKSEWEALERFAYRPPRTSKRSIGQMTTETSCRRAVKKRKNE